jgi:hypothetical protein
MQRPVRLVEPEAARTRGHEFTPDKARRTVMPAPGAALARAAIQARTRMKHGTMYGAIPLAMAVSFSLAGCIEVVEHRTTTVIDRQPLDPYVRRIPQEDRINLETAWNGGELIVRVLHEQMSVEYEAERKTVEDATIREPVSWTPIIIDGSLAAAGVATVVAGQVTKPDCRSDNVFDEGCGGGSLAMTVLGGAALAAATVLLIADFSSLADTKKRTVWDVPSGAMKRRAANVPVAGERVTLLFEDNQEFGATTDAQGVARLRVPGARLRPGARATLSLNGQQGRVVDLGAALHAP